MKCKKCGGDMKLVEGLLLLSNPPMYKYKCTSDSCGNVAYSTSAKETA